ncbi:protein translocase subunit secA [Magnetococcus marinus MC-1]|uniref:Protein translocase subunit SecA 1 n=1 Tax=Magnetococcus marinus (strain ATCC BAA-1437 / JCM 17883 / MC-1) TaxID=156889 RepID=SECA1_MAGMM|nr:preprotein translocase subunit SecA [Magnetococcus marinus]A0LCX0.1 RecName: Full=Protein translocase subunit SecA 1 [Magnetococcus marinus MC-1]ABK45813.1 protein translocase subunit secA [Magnetococcus marinus MC-1]
MFSAIARKLFGSRNDRYLRSLQPLVDRINGLEAEYEALSDSELTAMTYAFKARLEKGETLDDLLPEAFAVVREGSKRVLGMRHYDVQLIGGIVLHQGKISEMKTGEGKTLVATLSLYLNALSGKGAHLVTVNDYLARRDAEWMGKLYQFLGLSVGVIIHGIEDQQRKAAYNADITYGTNNEFGFDYLRDNMKFSLEEMVQRPLNYAIVDEVDSILVDEARTPLIISGPTEDSTDKYYKVDRLIPQLEKERHYTLDEKQRSVTFTEEGNEQIEQLMRQAGLLRDGDLYDLHNIEMVHHVNQALKAHAMFEVDRDYIVKDGQVVIIDEFTGRMMPGRRYSDGLHQALEAKEQVVIQNESQTLASITFQNLFRLYNKLAGMTGTADTEAAEFQSIYNLEVVIIPTNRDMVRIDRDDMVFRTLEEKLKAVAEDIKVSYEKGQPVLVGTVSIEKSEMVSHFLKKLKIPHEILNAKHHEREAEIVAQAGRPRAVTIATNMAGRGTDIQLGGNLEMRLKKEIDPEASPAERTQQEIQIRTEYEQDKALVLASGGLHIIGTERHESRRIDNQLRGRAGRQGDPGSSGFYLSLQDDLMRIFGSERMDGMLKKLGLQDGEAIVHPWINKAVESAQKKVEGRNFDIRKNLLKFDDVMNEQRKVIYDQRKELMENEDIRDFIDEIREEVVHALVDSHLGEDVYPEEWDAKGFREAMLNQFNLDLNVESWKHEEGVTHLVAKERAMAAVKAYSEAREARLGPPLMRYLEKSIMLQVLDTLWKEHLLNMDHLKEGIHLRGYAQKDPLNEYKREAFQLFSMLLQRIREEAIEFLGKVEVQQPEEVAAYEAELAEARNQQMSLNHPESGSWGGEGEGPSSEGAPHLPFKRDGEKVGRNQACPCGSGKKYKQCCGKLS